jgi:hypothetical protein
MIRRTAALTSLLMAATLCAVIGAAEPAASADAVSTRFASSELTIDWANLQFPPQISHAESVVDSTIKIYGQVYIAGATDAQDRPVDGVTAQVGFGPPGTLPASDQWYWFDMRPDPGHDFTQNNDAYVGKLLVPVEGTFKYTTRWSTDGGQTWTYTDQIGPPYDGADAGDLTSADQSDRTPPSPPSELTATPVSATEVELSWTPPPNIDRDIAGYRLYRKNASASSFSEVTSLVDPIYRSVTTSYTDTTVSNDATYSYYVTAIDVANNESVASNTADATTPLPVELTRFAARRAGGDGDDPTVALTWQTASETKNAGFRVERQAGGGDAEANWRQVGYVESKATGGTSSEALSYRYRDRGVPFAADTARYRLTQVDTDGTTSRSDVVEVALGAVEELQLQAPYPNPARGAVTVKLAVPKGRSTSAQLRLYNALGQEVRAVRVGERGRQRIEVQTDGLASGVYFLRLTAGERTVTRRVTVVR